MSLEFFISSFNIIRIKVTKLDRDAGSGTSLQEMTFWLNLERALQKIAQKRESDEVILTLEALKCGKRFHATVSFDADTGCHALKLSPNDKQQRVVLVL